MPYCITACESFVTLPLNSMHSKFSMCPAYSLSYSSRAQKFYTIPRVSIEIVISVQYPLFIVASSVLLHNAESSNLVVTPPHKSLVLIKLIVESLVVQNLAYCSSSYNPNSSSSWLLYNALSSRFIIDDAELSHVRPLMYNTSSSISFLFCMMLSCPTPLLLVHPLSSCPCNIPRPCRVDCGIISSHLTYPRRHYSSQYD